MSSSRPPHSLTPPTTSSDNSSSSGSSEQNSSKTPHRLSIPRTAPVDHKLRTEYLEVPSQSYLRRASGSNKGHLDSLASQQALFQAYLHAIRSGKIQMPSIALPSVVQRAQQQANHNQTIADVKRGVTYAGQDQLKKLPIPPLEDTCKRYLASVKPFLVIYLREKEANEV